MKYLVALLLCVRCAFCASIIQGGGTKSVLGAPPHYSFDDAQLLYHWTFDGRDITFLNTGAWTQTARVGASATMLGSAFNSGSFLTVMNNEMRPGVAGQGQWMSGNQLCRVTNLNLSAVSLMTVSLWIKPSYVLTYNGDKMIIEGGVTDWSGQTNAIIIDTGDGSRDFTLGIRDSVNTSLLLTKTFKNTNTFPVSNVWYHCAFVFDNTTGAGNVKMFCNSTNVTLTAGTSTKTSAVGKFGNHYWSFFSRGTGALTLPTTTVDDLRIYTNELTTAQLSEIYTNTAQWIKAP